jgi:hypothetical protein
MKCKSIVVGFAMCLVCAFVKAEQHPTPMSTLGSTGQSIPFKVEAASSSNEEIQHWWLLVGFLVACSVTAGWLGRKRIAKTLLPRMSHKMSIEERIPLLGRSAVYRIVADGKVYLVAVHGDSLLQLDPMRTQPVETIEKSKLGVANDLT